MCKPSIVPGNLYMTEKYINKTEGYGFGDSGDEPYETFSAFPGELYRASRNEYGRCTGKVYADREDGSTIHVGWVFEKKMTYDDFMSKETYIREVWVTLYTKGDDGYYRYAEI